MEIVALKADVVVTRAEAAVVRQLWLRHGKYETSDILGLDKLTLAMAAGRVPIAERSYRRLRVAFSRVRSAREI